MYIIIRTIEFKEKADRAKAIETAVKMADYLQRKQNLETKVTLNVGGKQNQLHFVVMSDSIDSAPAREVERIADEEWQALLYAAIDGELFSPGSISDAIHHVVG